MNAARIDARAAVSIASSCSSARRQATLAATPAEAARGADVIITMLTDGLRCRP